MSYEFTGEGPITAGCSSITFKAVVVGSRRSQSIIYPDVNRGPHENEVAGVLCCTPQNSKYHMCQFTTHLFVPANATTKTQNKWCVRLQRMHAHVPARLYVQLWKMAWDTSGQSTSLSPKPHSKPRRLRNLHYEYIHYVFEP